MASYLRQPLGRLGAAIRKAACTRRARAALAGIAGETGDLELITDFIYTAVMSEEN